MELTDAQTINFLIESQVPRRQSASIVRGARLAATSYPSSKTSPSRQCKCGRCHDCSDNARWERIFNDKFADPNYYCGLVVRYGSPLQEIS
jgi:hypothetical protein